METSFRKIDIDKYDEDVLNDEDLYDADPRDPAMVLEEAKQRQVAVRSSLAKWVFLWLTAICLTSQCNAWYWNILPIRNDTAGALAVILDSPPYGPNTEQAKVRIFPILRTIAIILMEKGNHIVYTSNHPQFDENDRNHTSDQVFISRCSRYIDEIYL